MSFDVSDRSPVVTPVSQSPELIQASFPNLGDIRQARSAIQGDAVQLPALDAASLYAPKDIHQRASGSTEAMPERKAISGSGGLIDSLDDRVSAAIAQSPYGSLLAPGAQMELKYGMDMKGNPNKTMVVRDPLGNTFIAYDSGKGVSRYVKDPSGKIVMTFPADKT